MRKLQGLWRRTRPDSDIIVVSGLPRSGTSLMMKMLEAGGLSTMTDGLRQADTDNPRGYYELEQVKSLSSGDVAWLADARGKVVKVIATLLYHLPDTHSYRVVFMRRPMTEILASQRVMLVNRGEDPDAIPDAEMGRIFTQHLERLAPFVAARPDLHVLEVDYHDVLAAGNGALIEQINDFLGGGLDTAAMAQVVDPDLYRQRQSS